MIVLVVLLCMRAPEVRAIYEEQGGEIDWVRQNIGSITRSKSANNLLYAVTDKSVVACLHEITGTVKWRVRSTSSGEQLFHDLFIGPAALYTVSSSKEGSGGVFARAWSLEEGYLLWETKLTDVRNAHSVVDVSFSSSNGNVVVMCNSNLYKIAISNGEMVAYWSASVDRDAKGVMESQVKNGFNAQLSQLIVSSPAQEESGSSKPDMRAVGCFVKSTDSSECSKAFIVAWNDNAKGVITLLPDMPNVLYTELRARISLPASASDGKWGADDLLFGPSQKEGKVVVLSLRGSKAVPVDLGAHSTGAHVRPYLLAAGSGAAPAVTSCTPVACSTYLLSLDSKNVPSAARLSGECDVSTTAPAPHGVSGVHFNAVGSSYATSVQASVSCAAFASEASSSTVIVEALSLGPAVEAEASRASYSLPAMALSSISHMTITPSLSALIVDGAGSTVFVSASSLHWSRPEQLCDTKQVIMTEFSEHSVNSDHAIHDIRSRLELQKKEIEEYYTSLVAFITDLPGFFTDYALNIKETMSKALLPAPARGDTRVTTREKQQARKQLNELREKKRRASAPSRKDKRFGFDKVAVCLSLKSAGNDVNVAFVDSNIRVSVLDLHTSTVLWTVEPVLPPTAATGKLVFARIVETPAKRGFLSLVVSMGTGEVFVWELDVNSKHEGAKMLRMACAITLPSLGAPAVSLFMLEKTHITRLEDRLLLVHRSPADGSGSGGAMVTVYPGLSGGVSKDVFLHTVDKAAGSLRIFNLNNHSSVIQSTEHATTFEALQVSAVHFRDERILEVVYPTVGDVIDKRFSVLGDDSILLKYLNPHVALVLTQGNATLFASVIDTASGKIMYRIAHESGAAPVHAVLVENVCVYTYWNDNARRTELSTVALYEGMIERYGLNPVASAKGSPVLQQLEREAHFSSFTSTPPLGVQKTYILPKSVTAIHHTITAHGIANKNVLLALSTGQLYSVDMRQIHPRRPFAEPTQFEKEEGLTQYNPFLQLSPLQAVTYDGVVEGGIHNILSAPTKLESTSLVLSFGKLDMHYNHVMPSQGFDLLSSDFNHGLLFTILSALALAALVLRRLAKAKQLNAAWK